MAPTKFRLSLTASAKTDAKTVPALLRRPIAKAIERLAREGCKVAGYALTGPDPWPKLCSVHVQGWRIVIAFPAEDEVTVVKIAPHDDANDPYLEIASDLGLDPHLGTKSKAPCCDSEGMPPVESTIIEQLEEAFAVLSRSTRKQRSSSRKRARPSGRSGRERS